MATNLNNLAILLRHQGEMAAARPLFARALAIRERVLGPDHPDTATSLDTLALLLQDQGELAAARSLFERALAIRERVLGPGHPPPSGLGGAWVSSAPDRQAVNSLESHDLREALRSLP